MLIPLHKRGISFHQKTSPVTNNHRTNENDRMYAAPEPFEPVTSENIENEIGLLKPYFLMKLQTTESGILLEEDVFQEKDQLKKVFRPKIPPTGKIATPKKRGAKLPPPPTAKKKRTDSLQMETASQADTATNVPSETGDNDNKMSDDESE